MMMKTAIVVLVTAFAAPSMAAAEGGVTWSRELAGPARAVPIELYLRLVRLLPKVAVD